MVIDLHDIQRINQALQDDISKTIYANRLFFATTGDYGYLRNVCMTIPDTREFDKWIQGHKDQERILFGAGKWGHWIKETFDLYNWSCFVDNGIAGQTKQSLPVICFNDLLQFHKDAAIVITSKFHWEEIRDQLIDNGFKSDNIYLFGKVITEVESRIYFDLPYLKKLESESFADVGGFNGETTKAFAEWAQDKWTSKIFEPGEIAQQKCRELLADKMGHVEIIPKGAWSSETVLFFNEDGSESALTQDRGVQVEVTTIDREYAEEPVTFIKMDIEGAELEALRGAVKTIEKYKPKLAISVYHKNDDLISIPKLILDINPDYKLYLRHYSMAWFDTVLYAI